MTGDHGEGHLVFCFVLQSPPFGETLGFVADSNFGVL